MGYQKNGKDLLTGALVGGILGGVAGLLIAPKSGRELREDIADNYCKISRSAQGFTDQVREKGRFLTHPFSRETVSENGVQSTPLLIGGLVGTVLGSIGAMLLAPQSGAHLREALGDKYEEIRERSEDLVSNLNSKGRNAMGQIEDWKDVLMTVVEKLSDAKGRKGHSKTGDIVEWANLGMRLLHQLQKRR